MTNNYIRTERERREDEKKRQAAINKLDQLKETYPARPESVNRSRWGKMGRAKWEEMEARAERWPLSALRSIMAQPGMEGSPYEAAYQKVTGSKRETERRAENAAMPAGLYESEISYHG